MCALIKATTNVRSQHHVSALQWQDKKRVIPLNVLEFRIDFGHDWFRRWVVLLRCSRYGRIGGRGRGSVVSLLVRWWHSSIGIWGHRQWLLRGEIGVVGAGVRWWIVSISRWRQVMWRL